MSEVPGTPSDTALLADVVAGDEAAFAMLFRRYAGTVHQHCARQLGSVEGADDQVAVVFLEAWRRRSDIRVVNDRVIAWLLVTATNVCRNQTRSRRRYRAALSRLPPADDEPDHAERVADAVARAEAAEALAAGLAELSRTDRLVVSLCLLNDMTYAEAAEALNLSHAAVRSRLARARTRLRTHLVAVGIDRTEEETSWNPTT